MRFNSTISRIPRRFYTDKWVIEIYKELLARDRPEIIWSLVLENKNMKVLKDWQDKAEMQESKKRVKISLEDVGGEY
jgi:hypothetical protein